ncbi:MAG: cellulose binding domain-containing protein [Oscillospiraceae bacterium]|jgi:hypothetical protein|nr:cellulose binding domain-containing protein [Oscillospiraceae bacterium]
MRNFNRRTAKKALSLFLSIIFILGMLTNCGIENNPNGELDAPVTEEPAEITAPDTIELSVPSLDGFEFEYEILNSSDTDFEASVRIINMNRTALDGWQLSFNGGFIITETRSAKLVSSENTNHNVINEFWTRTINPHSSAIFTFTAGKPAGAEITLENFILSHNDIPEEPPVPIELSPVTLRGFSELGYNVLVWDFDHNVGSYTIYRDSVEIAKVSGQNFYLDCDVEENQSYVYSIVQTLNGKTDESNQISVTVSSDEPEGASVRESISVLLDDSFGINLNGEPYVTYQQGDSRHHVSKNLIFANEGRDGSPISWFSSNEYILSSQGVVNRPTGSFYPIILTAIFQNDEYKMATTFELDVAPFNNAIQQNITSSDIAELNDGEKIEVVNRNGTFDSIGFSGFDETILSTFPIYSAEDAYNLIVSMGNLIGVDTNNPDIEFRFRENRAGNFLFSQYYKGLRITNGGSIGGQHKR